MLLFLQKTQPKENINQAPITTPMYGVNPAPMENMAPQSQGYNNTAATQGYNNTAATQGYQGMYNPQEHQNNIQPQAPAATRTVEPPKPVVKGPVPSEHQVLQEIFTTLIKNCSSQANNAVSNEYQCVLTLSTLSGLFHPLYWVDLNHLYA